MTFRIQVQLKTEQKSFSFLLKDCIVFNQPIGNWNTSNVTDMLAMFTNAQKFNKPIGNWDVGKVTDMSEMFLWANAFNQNLSNWPTNPNGTRTGFATGLYTYLMFESCPINTVQGIPTKPNTDTNTWQSYNWIS